MVQSSACVGSRFALKTDSLNSWFASKNKGSIPVPGWWIIIPYTGTNGTFFVAFLCEFCVSFAPFAVKKERSRSRVLENGEFSVA